MTGVLTILGLRRIQFGQQAVPDTTNSSIKVHLQHHQPQGGLLHLKTPLQGQSLWAMSALVQFTNLDTRATPTMGNGRRVQVIVITVTSLVVLQHATALGARVALFAWLAAHHVRPQLFSL